MSEFDKFRDEAVQQGEQDVEKKFGLGGGQDQGGQSQGGQQQGQYGQDQGGQDQQQGY
jgi:hypothetical protein